MRSYVKWKATLSFVWGRCFLSRQLHEIISCTMNGGGNSNNKRRQHKAHQFWWITCSIQSYYHHHLFRAQRRRRRQRTSWTPYVKKDEHHVQGVFFSFRRTTVSFVPKEASLVIDHLQKRKENTILHTISRIIFHINLNTHVFKYQIIATRCLAKY